MDANRKINYAEFNVKTPHSLACADVEGEGTAEGWEGEAGTVEEHVNRFLLRQAICRQIQIRRKTN